LKPFGNGNKQLMQRLVSLLLFFWITFVSHAEPSITQDTIESVLARMRPQLAVKIHYQETRFLALLSEPWQGSGYFYAALPDRMVKEQWYPQRELMGAKAELLLYFDPFADVRHQMEFSTDNPVSAQISAFKAMLTGDLKLMQAYFDIEFILPAQPADGWQLILKAKRLSKDTSPKIAISGRVGEGANQLTIYQADGDRTEYTFQKQAEGALPQTKITQLLHELQEK
jgi:hypothetical protein